MKILQARIFLIKILPARIFLMKTFLMRKFQLRKFLKRIFWMTSKFQGWWSCKCSRQSSTSTTSPNPTTQQLRAVQHGATTQQWPLQHWVATQHTQEHLNRVNHQQQQQQWVEQLDQLGGELHPTWNSETEEKVFSTNPLNFSSFDLFVF